MEASHCAAHGLASGRDRAPRRAPTSFMAHRSNESRTGGAARNVLGEGLQVRGRVDGEGDLRVEATIEGDVRVSGALAIGAAGRVAGRVSGASVAVDGDVQGDIDSAGPVTIGASATVVGDVSASELRLDEGARFQGSVQADFDLPDAIA